VNYSIGCMAKTKIKGKIMIDSELQFERANFDQSVYEVIRIIDGIALFLEDHFSRLQQSMKIQGISFEMDFQDFKCNIMEYVEKNQKQNGNIRFLYSKTESEVEWTFSFIPQSYPNEMDYLNGVTSDLLYAERQNPNAKVIQTIIREEANLMIANQKLYEVLLVDQDGLITEGSRSNVFFVKDNLFYTAPASKVLVGVTRKRVIDCLSNLKYMLVEEAVRSSEIGNYDAVFLTGTSPGVLPVRSIGTRIFDTSHPRIRKLMEQYNDLVSMYIQNEKNIR